MDERQVDKSVSGTGRGVRVGIVDSGVHAGHPHVGGVAGGVAFAADGREVADYVDRLGHGTAVTAAIKEKAPDAELFAIKVFDGALVTDVRALVSAIRWASQSGIRLVNLSLGTARPEHESVLLQTVDRARDAGALVVAASEDDGVRWLPGCLPGVVPVRVDWTCPRDKYRVETDSAGRVLFRASGFPREIPGVPPALNLKGISFAVANMTGFAARALEGRSDLSFQELVNRLSDAA
jgi:subtilisin family serine protease